MKKRKLKRQLKVTQHHLDNFMDATATQAIRIMEVEQQNADLHKKLHEAMKLYLCPWCCTATFKEASLLRLHEQECGSNRNRWRPESIAGLDDILKVCDLGNPRRPHIGEHEYVSLIIDHIKRLQHRARPVCVVCGESTKDLDHMRYHLGQVHGGVMSSLALGWKRDAGE